MQRPVHHDSNLNTESAGRKRSREAEKQSQMERQGGGGRRDKEKKRWKATKPIGATRKILPVSWLRSPGNSRTNEVPHPSAAF